ncbi:hypothetical protein [Aquipuribacter hungaricus]|uniref:PilN domain-containing protein n=1 Tax=Aquipuribacter hungaricus TaxID=545624 RepID=A0ABV7WC37_9MICO
MSTQTLAATLETVVPLTSEHPVARVDLMPPEIHERRRFARAKGWMGLALVLTVAGIGGGYTASAADAGRAQDELAVEQAQTVALQAEAAQYAEIPLLLARIERAETALETAMATDVEWYSYLSQIGQAAPSGVWFSSVSATAVVPGALSGDPLAPQDAVAEVVTTGRALTYTDVATWMDAFDGVSDLDHVLVSDATYDDQSGEDPWVDFTTSTKVAPSAYSDRYSRGEQ